MRLPAASEPVKTRSSVTDQTAMGRDREFATEWQQDRRSKTLSLRVGLGLEDSAAQDVYGHWLERDGYHVVAALRSEFAPPSVTLRTELPRLDAVVTVLILDPWLLDERLGGPSFEDVLKVRGNKPLLLLSTEHGLPTSVLQWARAHPYVRVLFRPDRATLRETVDELWMSFRRCSPA